jgi:hypothetical protein
MDSEPASTPARSDLFRSRQQHRTNGSRESRSKRTDLSTPVSRAGVTGERDEMTRDAEAL